MQASLILAPFQPSDPIAFEVNGFAALILRCPQTSPVKACLVYNDKVIVSFELYLMIYILSGPFNSVYLWHNS